MSNQPPTGNQPQRASSIPTPKMRRGPKGFFNEVSREMKKVSWPTKAETNRLTGVVLTVCGILTVMLTVLSYACEALTNLITQGKVF